MNAAKPNHGVLKLTAADRQTIRAVETPKDTRTFMKRMHDLTHPATKGPK